MLFRIACGAILFFGAVFGMSAPAQAQDDIAAQALTQINQARAENGLPALKRNAQLDAAEYCLWSR